MRRFEKDEMIGPRGGRGGAATPLLSVEEQLESVVLELTLPVEHVGEEITEMTLRAHEPADILDFEYAALPDRPNVEIRLLSDNTGVSQAAIRKLHPRDFNRLRALYWAFGE